MKDNLKYTFGIGHRSCWLKYKGVAVGHFDHEVDVNAILDLEAQRNELQAELDAANRQIDGLKAESQIHHKIRDHMCSTCGGTGFVGSAPDDYYDCPECVERNNKGDAAAITKLVNERAYSAVVDGVAITVIDAQGAIDYADRLKAQ